MREVCCFLLLVVIVVGCASTRNALWDEKKDSSIDQMASYMRPAALSCIPVGSFVVFTVLGLIWKPKKTVVSSLQHLTAGVITAAVAVELLPLALQSFKGTIMDCQALVVGFFVAVAGLSFLRIALPDHDPECEGKSGLASLERSVESKECSTRDLKKRSLSRRTHDVQTARSLLPEVETFAKVTKKIKTFFMLPWVLLAPLAVDLFLDGLLLAVVARSSAGYVISVGFAIETAIVGCSTSATLTQKQFSSSLVLLVSAILSVVFLVGVGVGSAAFSFLTGSGFLAILSFGIGSLLFLAIDVLLVEARESSLSSNAQTRLWFYIGFVAVFAVHLLLE
jgi:ZIP family zinc transporter